MAGKDKDYVIGKGRLYFDPFVVGTTRGSGEMYFGNTPELTTTADAETLDHYDADQGLNVKDESITVENNLSGAFVTDNISPDNVALFFSGSAAPVVQTAQTNKTETILAAQRNRSYQLGVTDLTPTGARHVHTVTIERNGEPLANLAQNVEIDLEKGRIYIEADAPDILANDSLVVKYDVQASNRTVIIGRGDEIRGSLRFISNNPVGSNKDYYWPYVKLTPNGDYALKGSEWMQLGFSFEVLKLAGRERVYAETHAVSATQANRPATGKPVITGTAQIGQVLSAATTAISDPDGMGVITLQWLRDGASIASATGETYTPVTADLGARISVRASFTDQRGNPELLVSDETAQVIAA